MDKKRVITTKDVAEAAGVSRLTVSRVINSRGGVTQKTVEDVRRAMEDLGYAVESSRPRRGPKPKDSERLNLVAFVAAGVYDSTLRSDVYHNLSMAIEHALAEHDCSMVIRRLPPGSEALPDMENVAGAVILGDPAGFAGQTKPYVQVMGHVPEGETWDHITYDGYRAGVLAADYLLKQGCRRGILLCATPEVSRPRHHGFLDTFRQAGKESVLLSGKDLYIRTEMLHTVDREAVSSRLDQLQESQLRSAGLFVDTDLVTASLYPLLYDRGIVPGRDLPVVSCNNERSVLAPLSPRPPSVDIHARQIGRKAVEQLFYRMDHPAEPATTVKYQPTIAFE